MKKLKIGLFGAGGRMGQEIAHLLTENTKMEAFVGVDRSGKAPGFTHALSSLQGEILSEVDLWIDFSLAEATDQILKEALRGRKPLVSGTTGISDLQKKALKSAGAEIPVLWSSNMSLGVAVLNEAIRLFSKLEGFDFQIEEIHHNRKKDKPSGTALTLQETLRTSVQKEVPEPLAIRGGGVFGVHKVWAFSEEEQLMFEHQALNRAVFARGAIRAAEWLAHQNPGLYRLHDVLVDH